MFKKISKIIIAVTLGVMAVSPAAFADVNKGQRIFIRFMKEPCGFDGGTMAKKHTQAEWKTIFEGGKLNEELLKFCPSAQPLKENQVQDVYDFLYHYGSVEV